MKEAGNVYQAAMAKELRHLGVRVSIDDATGSAKVAAIPEFVRSNYSGRHNEGEAAAREYAAAKVLEWNDLSEPSKRALMDTGTPPPGAANMP